MAIITSNATGGGDSNVGASWAGGIVPISGDKVIVAAGDTITLVTSHTWGHNPGTHVIGSGAGSIEINGTLKFSRAASATLTCLGQILVLNGGRLDMGSSADPISNAAVVAALALNNTAVNGQYGLEIVDGGQWTAFGVARQRWTKLSSGILATATSATVDAATNWQVGDEVFFGSTQAYNATPRIDRKTLTSVVGTTIGWSGGVTYDHGAGCHVINAASNVRVIRASTGQTYVHATHTSIGGTRSLDHTELRQIGVNATNKLGLHVLSTLANITVQPWGGVRSCVFVDPEAYGLTLDKVQLPFVNTDNCFARTAVAGVAVNMLQCGDLGSIDDAVMIGVATCLSSSSQPGSNELVLNRLKATGGGSTAVVSPAPALGWRLVAPEIGGCNSVFSASQPQMDVTVEGGTIGAGALGANGTILNIPSGKWRAKLRLLDCTLQASGLESGLSGASKDSEIIIGNRDNTPALQQAYYPHGTITRDTASGYDGADCVKFDPTSTTVALKRQWTVPAVDGATVSVGGFVKRSASGVTLTATLSGMGVTPVVQVFSGSGSGAWQQIALTTVQSTGGNGALTLTIEVTGTSGNALVDALSAPATAAMDTGEIGFWSDGLPVSFLSANFTTQAALQAALTAQGYTTARAGNLDTIAADVWGYTLP